MLVMKDPPGSEVTFSRGRFVLIPSHNALKVLTGIDD